MIPSTARFSYSSCGHTRPLSGTDPDAVARLFPTKYLFRRVQTSQFWAMLNSLLKERNRFRFRKPGHGERRHPQPPAIRTGTAVTSAIIG